jgi:acid phosphatase type 7
MGVIIMLEPRVVGVGGLDAAGRARASRQGIRQFVVGTGGADLLGFAAAQPNSQRRLAGVHGVLELVLHPASYQ